MVWIAENRALIATLLSVVALLLLITRARMHPFPALLVAGLCAALGAGLAPAEAIASIKKGLGSTLGTIAAVIGLGSMFGVIIEAGGGVSALARYVTQGAGPKATRWLLGMVGVIVAVPVFFDVALIILFPLVIALARRLNVAPLALGLPLLAGLASAHAFIPPTPGPIAVAQQLQVGLGWVILFGTICAIPAMIVGGPLYAAFAEKRHWLPDHLVIEMPKQEQTVFDPRLARLALLLILVPLIMIVFGAVFSLTSESDSTFAKVAQFVGDPIVALLTACGMAVLAMRPATAQARATLITSIERSLEPVGVVLLVTGAGGAFKQVLVDSGAGQSLAESTLAIGVTPIVAGFLLALMIRIAQGSATAAMITAASLTFPITEAAGLTPPQLGLVAVSIAAGATAMSHVNDSGFWLVNRYFNLSTQETLRSWTVASTLTGLTGFAMTLMLSLFI